MNKIFLSILTLVLFALSNQAIAETPQEIAASFLSVAGTGDYETAASFFGESDLAEFRRTVRALEPEEELVELVFRDMFGRGTTIESVDAMSDAQFFAGFLKIWFDSDEFVLDAATFKVIGEVREDNGMVHVLTRHTFYIEDEPFETVTTTQVIDSGSSPYIAMPPEIEAIPKLLELSLTRYR